jgi:uncharacterized ParB-like nuclease family protein
MKTKLKETITMFQYLLKSIFWITNKSKVTFHYLTGINRGIYPSQVTKLANALLKMGNIRPVVVAKLSFITGKMAYYIVDGQHLYNALLRLGWDIPYVVIEVKDKKDLVDKIAYLNSSSKTWSVQDYVTAWSSLVPDYVKLNRYFQIYDIELNIISAILSNGNLSSGSTISKKLKSGEFAIEDEEKNVEILNGLTDVLKIIPRLNRFENRYVCSEYVNFRRTSGCSYNHKTFIKNLDKNKQKFILATHQQEELADMFRKLTK